MKGTKLHEVERSLLSSLLQLGLQLLGYYILLVKKLVHQEGVPVDSQATKMKNKGQQIRSYFSVFGRLGIERPKYYSTTEKTYYSLDAALGLPAGSYSYLIEDWLAFGAVEVDFDQSVAFLERILGHQLHGMQSSRCTYHLSEQVEDFYEQKDWHTSCLADADSTHLSVSYDGKGVPIMRSQTGRAQESVSTRLSKGQKKGVKKEATVSVSSCFTAKQRNAEDIITRLFSSSYSKPPGQPVQDKHNWHENKHIRTFLSDKQKAIAYGIDNVLKRDDSGAKPIIVLIDGDRSLEKAIQQTVKEKGIPHRVNAYILDFIHLLEYVWKVANAHWGEKHSQREAWVKEHARLLLQSEWQQVLEEWQHILDTKELTSTQAYNIQGAITYLSNRPHMIDYKTYLEKGYPITTGAVESACGHFVKSRMERNAMHWGKEGAQKMLNIRAVKKNQDWDSYMENFISMEQHKLYMKAA